MAGKLSADIEQNMILTTKMNSTLAKHRIFDDISAEKAKTL